MNTPIKITVGQLSTVLSIVQESFVQASDQIEAYKATGAPNPDLLSHFEALRDERATLTEILRLADRSNRPFELDRMLDEPSAALPSNHADPLGMELENAHSQARALAIQNGFSYTVLSRPRVPGWDVCPTHELNVDSISVQNRVVQTYDPRGPFTPRSTEEVERLKRLDDATEANEKAIAYSTRER